MYKFIKCLQHSNVLYSHVAYLYQHINTKKYYLSYIHPDEKSFYDDSNQYVLLDNQPKIIRPEFFKNIGECVEINKSHIDAKNINGYILL